MQTLSWTLYVGIGHEPPALAIDASNLDQLAVDMLRRMGAFQNCHREWIHPDTCDTLHVDPWLALSAIRSRSKVDSFKDRLRELQQSIAADFYRKRNLEASRCP